ncbi:transposase [Tindallia californiensis]|uniref:Transposase n=1 Tax=Tindallia californiensis TaxID=159292 RepID=A0A1H3RE32_9FIRM|nr:transposase [Tindallia californiensis]SDZ23947.1 Transposase [Tindallia californiensis]
MALYSESFKISIMQKMMPPKNQKVSTTAQESGMSEGTLYKWKKEAKAICVGGLTLTFDAYDV